MERPSGIPSEAVADAFDLGLVLRFSDGPTARGKQGQVWRLDTTTGAWAVKVAFEPVSEDDVAPATELQEAAWAAGVPTPEVRRARDGRVLSDVGDARVRVHSWIDLERPDPFVDPALVGDLLGRLHSVAPPTSEPPGSWYTDPVGAGRWDALVADLRAAGAPFAGELADLRDDLVELESWLVPPRRLRLCHRDLWADNVLPTSDGGVCVVDWDESGPADPAQELGCVLFEFARSDPGRVRDLLAAYRGAGGTATIGERGDLTMLVAQLGHVTETAGRDWLAPNPRSPRRSDAEAWIRETLDDPHTPRLLDRLLAEARAAQA